MAGHGHGPHPVRHDPAIDRFYNMRENIADGFKFSRKSGRFVFLSLGLVPAVLLWGAYASGGQIDMAARRKTESIWRSQV